MQQIVLFGLAAGLWPVLFTTFITATSVQTPVAWPNAASKQGFGRPYNVGQPALAFPPGYAPSRENTGELHINIQRLVGKYVNSGYYDKPGQVMSSSGCKSGIALLKSLDALEGNEDGDTDGDAYHGINSGANNYAASDGHVGLETLLGVFIRIITRIRRLDHGETPAFYSSDFWHDLNATATDLGAGNPDSVVQLPDLPCYFADAIFLNCFREQGANVAGSWLEADMFQTCLGRQLNAWDDRKGDGSGIAYNLVSGRRSTRSVTSLLGVVVVVASLLV